MIERLYSIDRGTTQLLIEQGIDAWLIQHGKSDRPAGEVVALIRDQESAVQQVFDFVGSQRPLSTSFIKQLHQLLTKNQPYTEAVDQFGRIGQVELIRGDWKRLPNNPTRPDGSIHHYCPPEQMASQMDQLISWHLEHMERKVSPEVEAAWLHHRFTQIHPFQDGNGRVARLLATLVFLRAGWFPLIVLDDSTDELTGRNRYIGALESADEGDLHPLINLFADAQRRAFISSLSLSEEAMAGATLPRMLDSVLAKVAQTAERQRENRTAIVERYALLLHQDVQSALRTLEHQIRDGLSGKVDIKLLDTTSVSYREPRHDYYRYQIVQIAKQHGYYANTNGYRSWVRLRIWLDDLQTVLLFSFHGLGVLPTGIMVCSAFAYRRLIQGDETGDPRDLERISHLPFEFTYQEQEDELRKRFASWLDETLKFGVKYWESGLYP